jgi:S-DNA-T family DNA segregation ATPase FtsK/SpoIIIE
MAHTHPIDTDDGAVPAAVRQFLKNRVLEVMGIVLTAVVVALGLALASWSVSDPSFNRAVDTEPGNLLGYPGAVIADELMQLFGLGVIVLIAVPMAWAVRFMRHEPLDAPIRSVIAGILTAFCAAGLLALFPAPSSWGLMSGLGGNAGDILSGVLMAILNLGLKGIFASIVSAILLGMAVLGLGSWATGVSRGQAMFFSRVFGERSLDIWATFTGWIGHLFMVWKARRAAREEAVAERRTERKPKAKAAPAAGRVEPLLDRKGKSKEPWLKLPPAPENDEEEDETDETDEMEAEDEEEADAEEAAEDSAEDEDDEPVTRVRVSRAKKQVKPGRKARRDSEPPLPFDEEEEFELPSLTLLAEPKRPSKGVEVSDEALEQNARMLEGVLDDFGVKGQIINVRPGPVVTLYELEPAPGIKSSRVISLADDIARSMSAVSARVAVVQGRNAIGIELPNVKRETVFLRELLASESFEKTGQNLALALGKNIGGEPVFADLARMPHLLIAGTTGSGKSVGINTMILSLLYRLPPERCKLIMIDPKMLELSVYEGIPHLLAPVVTDPRKAVVALKWAVREMEDRYRKMSKVGVRNIDGYNARVNDALAKGKNLSRTVQTGFDPESGEPIFEQEEMDMAPMPYIVVIIDEMADLMMVAGKDIEGAVQRLAQMARAAGIHVIMATQRPSVDVITGTIKANFPTRVSFQVTSKIDSRTILGEQGAEQLLGQGDMLYMAGGGRISRLHGPFVSDDEVEKIVRFLKTQGTPEYLEAVTEEVEDGDMDGEGGMPGLPGGGSGDELYDQAVAVVLRDKKVSTSYVQRRLQIGYNKAASLIERMEKEGLISAANATGKREILVPGDSAED